MAQKVFGITFGKEKTPKNVTKIEGNEAPMPVSTWKPTLPTVNVIPVSIIERYETKALIRKFIGLVAVLVLIFSALFGYSIFANMMHQQEMVKYDQESTQLNSQITELKPYEAYKTDVASKMSILASYLSTDVDVSKLLDIFYNAAGTTGIAIDTVTVNINDQTVVDGTTPTSSCVQTDPFNKTNSIGCIVFRGAQPSPEAVAAFFNILNNQEGFVDDFLENTSTSGTDGSSFSGSISFTDFFYSEKYTNLTLDIDSLINGGGLDNATAAPEETNTDTNNQDTNNTDNANNDSGDNQ